MSTISLRGVTKSFGKLKAVDAVDLDVGAGEVVCLLGPSGCGKTTTLRMIAGLESASAGDVMVAGRRVNELAPSERDVAMVFQFYALYPSLTVKENLAFPLLAERLPAAVVEERVMRVARTLDLTACSAASRAGWRRARSSGSRSAGRSCATRTASCSTSRSRASTSSCARRCAARSRRCSRASRRRR
jgi:ABC-type sugar transport system ATPase subunit